MKTIHYLLFLLLLIPNIEANSFNMSMLRAQERSTALHEFKKLYQSRQYFQHQMMQKTRHKRTRSLKHHTVFQPPSHAVSRETASQQPQHKTPQKYYNNTMKPPPQRLQLKKPPQQPTQQSNKNHIIKDRP